MHIMNAIAYILTHLFTSHASFLNILALQGRTRWINVFLNNILYCMKQIDANTTLPWRFFFS